MVEIVREAFGLIRALSGSVSLAELDSSAIAIQGDALLDEMRYNIHDFTAVTDALLSDSDIEFLAARANVAILRNPRLKIAFVGSHPIVHQLMVAFNNTGIVPNKVVRFDTLSEAREYACN